MSFANCIRLLCGQVSGWGSGDTTKYVPIYPGWCIEEKTVGSIRLWNVEQETLLIDLEAGIPHVLEGR